MMPNAAETIEKLARKDEQKALLLEAFAESDPTNLEELKKLQERVRKYLESNR